MKDKFATMGKKAMIACAIIAVIVVAVAYWWFHPPINIHSDGHVDVHRRVHSAAVVFVLPRLRARVQGDR